MADEVPIDASPSPPSPALLLSLLPAPSSFSSSFSPSLSLSFPFLSLAGGVRAQHLLSHPFPLSLSLSQEVYALNTYSVENVPAVVAVALKRFDQSLNKASRLPLVSV